MLPVSRDEPMRVHRRRPNDAALVDAGAATAVQKLFSRRTCRCLDSSIVPLTTACERAYIHRHSSPGERTEDVTIVENRKVEELPLHGRDFGQLVRHPGVAASCGGGEISAALAFCIGGSTTSRSKLQLSAFRTASTSARVL